MGPPATRAYSWRRPLVSAQIVTSIEHTSWRPLHSSGPATSPPDKSRLALAVSELAVAETAERIMRFAELLRSERVTPDTPAGSLQDHLALASARLSRY